MSLAKAFAPGKVILLGEHAVVYGFPALAGPLEQGVTVTLEKGGSGISLKGTQEGPSPIAHALRKCAQAFHVSNVEVEITGDLPQSVGLGSSAAVSVALVRAFSAAGQISMRPQGLLERALELERDFHGSASGVDHNVSFERQLIRFVKGRRGQPVILPRQVEAVVWVVEPRGSTRERVAEIKRKQELDPERSQRQFELIGALVDEAVEALEKGDLRVVGKAMDQNHKLLQELGLSTPGLDDACARLRSMGAFGAKLTGAGGGGAVVALFEDADPVVSTLVAEGHRAFVARWEAAQ
ncbi:MAG: mevalonate kinase [Deltaproteobacteria bacterium]|nr:mevalonate kinase [Deltaproteobacteria bacterium]